MTDYNWKSCADPANAARLRELLEAGRSVVVNSYALFTVLTEPESHGRMLDNLETGRDWRFLDPDEPAQIRPHTCECICECDEPTHDDLCADCHVGDIRGRKCQTWRARIAELEAEVKCGRYC